MVNKFILLMASMCIAVNLQAAQAEVPPEQIRDRVSFQVDVQTEVENDWLVAVLHVTAEDRRPENVAGVINDTMRWALQQLKDSEAIQSRTGSYQTHPVYDDRKIVRWRGRQELHLESRSVEQLSQLIGVLQERLQMHSMQFSVSPEERARVEERLVEEVLKAWQKRAAVIARALGSKNYELMDVAIHTGPGGPVIPVHTEMRAMKRADVGTPALESGTSRITVQASGSIRLLRD